MAVKFSNNAVTTLSAGITNSATSIAVADGSVFPALGAGEHFYATITDGTNIEIIRVTARSGNTLTATRGQDGTTGTAFVSGDDIELRVTAAGLADIPADYLPLAGGSLTGDVDSTANLEAVEFIGDLRGPVLFKAQAGEALAKGDVVYISGISGNTTVVSKADADDANKMPAFGLAAAAANLNAAVDIYTFGTLTNLDTSSFTIGDTLYVSTTAGALANSPPTGESSLIQNIGKVTRSDASVGSIKIGGAGRTNATPNLNNGNVFIGNASNQAVARALVEADISDFGTYLTSFTETNDLTAAVTWANVPDANITQSSVTQHQSALSITESQISDLGTYLTGNQTITLSGDVSGSGTTSIVVTVADDSHNHIISNVDGLQTALDAKAALASPTFTGTPAAPTATAGTNTTQIATTAFVTTAVANGGGGGGGAVTDATVYVATISTTQNVNTASTIAWNNILVSDANFSNSSGVITVGSAGKYRIYSALSMTGTVVRSNVRVRIAINGTTVGTASGQSGYIRASSGHNESTVYVEDIIDLNANDTIRIRSEQEGAAGTVSLIANQSRLIIEKVEIGTGAAAGNSSTTGKTLTTADMNTTINASGNIIVPDSVAAAGDIVVVHNTTAGNISIADGTIDVMRLAGSGTTGTRTLAQRGVAFLYFASATEVIVGGTGVT